MKKIFFVLLIIVLFSLAPSIAAHKNKSIEIYPYFSQHSMDGDTFLENTTTYGMRIGFNFSKTMQGEFLYSVGDTETDSYGILYVDPTFFEETPQEVFEEDEIRMWFFNFIYNFRTPKENLVPYIIAGAGRYRIIREFDIIDSQTRQPVLVHSRTGDPIVTRDSQSSPAFTIGGGIRSYVSKRFAVRFEVKAIQFSHDVSGLTYDSNDFEYGFRLNDDDFLNYEASLGIAILLGGRER
jgi:hypothetical protein